MSKAVPSLFLVRIKQEPGSGGSDCASSGDEWHPSPSPTLSNLSKETKIPLLPPSVTSPLSTNQLYKTNSLYSCIDMRTTGAVTMPNSSEAKCSKCEPEDSSCMKRTDESGGELRLKPQSNECEICGKVFSKISNLVVHIKSIHIGLRPFACEICGRNFERMSRKEVHVNNVHKNLREFVCKFCEKVFAERSKMTRHIKVIHGELREFSCEFCGKAFAQNSDVQRHIKTVHKGLREFACEFCGRAFAQRSNMKKHIKVIHGEPT